MNNEQLLEAEAKALAKMEYKPNIGRPRKYNEKIERKKVLFNAARLGLSLQDAAAVSGMQEKTINRYLKLCFKKSYVQFKNQQLGFTRHKLIEKAMQVATSKNPNPAMLTFLLKNFCGLRDNPDNGDSTKDNTITLNYNLEEPPEREPIKDVN